MDIFQERNFKGIQVGHPQVLKDKLVEKTGLAEGGFWLKLRKKDKSMPVKEEAGNSRGLQGCCEICRENIIRANIQLELNQLLLCNTIKNVYVNA